MGKSSSPPTPYKNNNTTIHRTSLSYPVCLLTMLLASHRYHCLDASTPPPLPRCLHAAAIASMPPRRHHCLDASTCPPFPRSQRCQICLVNWLSSSSPPCRLHDLLPHTPGLLWHPRRSCPCKTKQNSQYTCSMSYGQVKQPPDNI